MGASSRLPLEIYHNIFVQLPPADVLTCRFLDKSTSAIATAVAFRHVRLEDTCHARILWFEAVARSPHLGGLVVREVTVDTSYLRFGSADTGAGNIWPWPWPWPRPAAFLRALPCLRLFAGLRTLNVRFGKATGTREDQRFRDWVLRVVFEVLAGEWSTASRDELDAYCIENWDGGEKQQRQPIERTPPIRLRTLTISNLGDHAEERLTASPAFGTVLASPEFQELKLLVALRHVDPFGENPPAYQDQQVLDFAESLPRTWLAAPLARNLRVLSLYFSDYWGWTPKMDFRLVNPVEGGFPNLCVLALGNYVFSHEWQVEWIAGLGTHNGRGLQELYLDDCPILWRARAVGPLDNSVTVVQTGDGGEDDTSRATITISNEGYPRKHLIAAGATLGTPMADRDYPLRWHHMLRRWTGAAMPALRVFRMGHGDWDGVEVSSVHARLWPPPPRALDHELRRFREQAQLHRRWLRDRAHLTYDSPAPPPDSRHLRRFSRGVGLATAREHVLQYVCFDLALLPQPWVERDDRRRAGDLDRVAEYEASRAADEAALRELLAVVAERNYPSTTTRTVVCMWLDPSATFSKPTTHPTAADFLLVALAHARTTFAPSAPAKTSRLRRVACGALNGAGAHALRHVYESLNSPKSPTARPSSRWLPGSATPLPAAALSSVHAAHPALT
ncbi:hypothetical protein DL766_001128 [Monosporascus sp. MC13-8B]|uniref:F-box domain-containing protein n=1 Tax=Monosporascus cannonballus TaxID=155416 RepID=A0ABY0GU55_9PEZI|nr:hypothetical protein DL762_009330 [Monosporascus cannonballus]RYO90550.1 hypothetical protein DL763_005315 [Monosporascus cannonballus]RYP38218.1 hypothetical protein DL766_001128 [Monosporascus sp. MC13-8B]